MPLVNPGTVHHQQNLVILDKNRITFHHPEQEQEEEPRPSPEAGPAPAVSSEIMTRKIGGFKMFFIVVHEEDVGLVKTSEASLQSQTKDGACPFL